jgi:hypothetical protein
LAALRDLDPLSGRVEIIVPNMRYPRDIEATAYFLCVEALTNVAKYAHATIASVMITATRRTLVVEISDNGIGGADPAKGTGLLGLQERLDVIGGVLTVQVRATALGSAAPSHFKPHRHAVRRLPSDQSEPKRAPPPSQTLTVMRVVNVRVPPRTLKRLVLTEVTPPSCHLFFLCA